eukprot:TRINITY_DN2671_c2_g2_i4.p1 TRINITY_DN2671_c2_g2~~TRINITY_DN2671_c2_g2_i4.p1  ORF type:complete len:523 (-),score=50.10 TRINITY_DN2671_c2_g2_i4:118-1686(-)
MRSVVAASLPVLIASVTVKTPLGDVHGSYDPESGVSVFKGIPFARPPVGDLRFADPEPWTEPYPHNGFNATNFGSRCVSRAQQDGSEDCLFLNIYVPGVESDDASSLPVLFFIHGGAFVIGSSNGFGAVNLAKEHGAVVVTINYRLGPFGWAQFTKGPSNFGLKDQREALSFIRRSEYIAAFHGDVSKIMMFGESAGAISTILHLVTPRSFGMFSSALFESGFAVATPSDTAIALAAKLSQAVNCGESMNVVGCLRSKTTAEILEASDLTSANSNPFLAPMWGPSIDYDEFSDDPRLLFMQGKHARVPVLGGSNTDEGIMFVFPDYKFGMSSSAYKQFVREFISNGRPFNETLYNSVLELYPPSSFFTNVLMASDLLADATFVCGGKHVVQQMDQSFLYHFAYHGNKSLAYHGSELKFIFDWKTNPVEKGLAEVMRNFWVSFANSGRPAPESQWPQYRNATDTNIVFNIAESKPSLTTEVGRRLKYCDFWTHQGIDLLGALNHLPLKSVPSRSTSGESVLWV